MAQPAPSGNIEAQIQGEISGQVAVGNYNIQIGAIHGGVVNVAVPEQQPRPRPRPTPVFLRPRPFPGLLDREAEVSAATTALQSTTPVEFHGQAGLGKTTLLRHLSYQPAATSFPDGVIYLSAHHQPVDDLLQSLFDAFYESDVPFKPTDTQVRHALQDKQALILLDDVDLARDEVEALMDAAPGCTFLLASPERRLWGEGRVVALHGLSPDKAQMLVERELGRPLTPEEGPAAQALCTALDGHPLRLLQVAAMAREEGRSLTEMARRTRTASPAETLTAETLNALPQTERQVLAVLAALDDVPLHADHLAALTGLADVSSALETLQRRGLVQAHSPRYSLAGTLGDYLQQAWDLTPWAEQALAYFTTWAEGRRSAPDQLLEEADAILRTLEWGVSTGRWAEVLRLGRAVEGALALGRRWGAWAQVLQWVLQATQVLGNQAAEAWALHQLGSRALCLGDAAAARTSLSQALHMREAIGDRAGAAVTRHNLNLLPGVPPSSPRKPPAPKAGPSPAVWLTLLAGTVIAASLLVAIVVLIIVPPPTPPTPSPQPGVNIWLAGGCDREYEPGSPTQILLRANVDSGVSVRLDGRELLGRDMARDQTYKENWEVIQEPGEHRLSAVLDSGVSNECRFSVRRELPPPPEVSIWLAEGCNRVYEPGFPTQILLRANMDSGVSIRLDDQKLFGVDVVRDQTHEKNWEVTREPGEHRLSAVLDSGASSECWFSVQTESVPPAIGNIWIEPMFGEPVCPEDKVWVYVQVSDGRGPGRVEIRARYPAGSGNWVPGEMEPLDDQTYRHPLQAHEEPGIEFFIYVEDGHGNSAQSDVQVYVVEPCVTIGPQPDTQGPDISDLKTNEQYLDNSCTYYLDYPCEMDVYVNVEDPSDVKWVKLIYVEPGKTTEIPAGMTNVGGASYKATVNANGWNQGTLRFYVRASDNRDNVSQSSIRTMTVNYCLW